MKTYAKKIFYSFIVFLVISCASTPKNNTAVPQEDKKDAAAQSLLIQTDSDGKADADTDTEPETAEDVTVPAVTDSDREKNTAADIEENNETVSDSTFTEQPPEKINEAELVNEGLFTAPFIPSSTESSVFLEPEVIDIIPEDIIKEPEVFAEFTPSQNEDNNKEDNNKADSSINDSVNNTLIEDKAVTETAEKGKSTPESKAETEKGISNAEVKAPEDVQVEPEEEKEETVHSVHNERIVPLKEQEPVPETRNNETEPAKETKQKQKKQAAATPEPQREKVSSRSVTIKKDQVLDVIYPGDNWVYLGEVKDSFLNYFGRVNEPGRTIFSFKPDKSGTTVLHFHKTDALTGKSADDYLSVIIENSLSKDGSTATAPLYAEIVTQKSGTASKNNYKPSEKKETKAEPHSEYSYVNEPEKAKTTGTKSQDTKTQASQSTPLSSAPAAKKEDIYIKENVEVEPEVQVTAETEDSNVQKSAVSETTLEKAKRLFNEKKYEESLELCQNYIGNANVQLDEAYYLLGQLYESDSSVKNIKNALSAYETVTKRYPLSKLWKKANQRSFYLKRFYIDIR